VFSIGLVRRDIQGDATVPRLDLARNPSKASHLPIRRSSDPLAGESIDDRGAARDRERRRGAETNRSGAGRPLPEFGPKGRPDCPMVVP
jgi:hypothetical protein